MASISFNSTVGFYRALGLNNRKGKIVSRRDLREIIYEGLEEVWKRGLGLFVITAVRVLPVETGMTVATLLPAAEQADSADAVRAVRAAFSRATKNRAPHYPRVDKDGNFINSRGRTSVRGMPRDAATGYRLGKQRTVVNLGSVNKFTFGFAFTYAVGQHKAADLGLWDNIKPPRESLDRGRAVMFEYILEAERQLEDAVIDWLNTGDEKVLAQKLFRISRGT